MATEAGNPQAIDPEAIDRALAGVAEEMIAFRRDLHAHPELSWHEVRTTEQVGARLAEAGIGASGLPGRTGLIGEVGSDPGGPLIALRADLDALPIVDEKDVEYRSGNSGVTHACGHDVHTSVVLGAAIGLARMASEGAVPGRVRLLFQPAEEVMPGGAMALLDAGALEGVQRVFALHCDPRIDAGAVALRPGPMTGAADSVIVRMTGPGGHTSRPQLTVDLVGALAEVVARTPAVLSRRVDPRAGMSIVWGRIAAGTAANVIPQSGEAVGSVRTLDPAAWRSAEKLIPEMIREIAAPYQARVDVEYVPGVPPAVNDALAAAGFAVAAAQMLGPAAVREVAQSMGAEDFAWILERVPGVLARLGVRRPGASDAPDLHRGDFDVDEAAIGVGMRVLVAAALGALETL
jgi:amidohydrolase